jgi:hypothetical protein
MTNAKWLCLLSVPVACLVTGCLNVEEEITLKRNGSGRVNLHYWVASDLAKMASMGGSSQGGLQFSEEAVRKEFEGKPGVKLISAKVEEKEGQTHVRQSFTFDKVESLNKLNEGETMAFAREGGQLTFTSKLSSQGGGFSMGSKPAAPGAGASAPAPSPQPSPQDRRRAEESYRNGLKLKKAKKLQQAASEFQAATMGNRDHLDAHWALAWTYAALDQRPFAGMSFREVLRLAPPGSTKAKEAKKALDRLDKGAPSASPMGLPAPMPAQPGAAGQPPADLGKAMGQGMQQAMTGMMGAMMGGGDGPKYKVTVHFPGEVLTVDGPKATKEKNTATWEVPFTQLMMSGMGEGITLKATAKAGFPVPLPVLAGAAAVVVLIALGVALKRRKKRKSPPLELVSS